MADGETPSALASRRSNRSLTCSSSDTPQSKKRVSFAQDLEEGEMDENENPELQPLLSPPRPSDRKVYEFGGDDILQFSASMYYVDEEAAKLEVDIIRLGSMDGVIAARFLTEDLSAKATVNYERVTSHVVFEAGEHTKRIEIPILDDGLWSATKEFKLCLAKPQNCNLGEYLFCARVKILNAEAFPSDVFRDVAEEPNLEKINGLHTWSLFREYWKLNFFSSGQRLSIMSVLIFDQLQALFLFGTLCVGVYIIDTIFERGDPEAKKRLLLPDRYHTAMLVAAWYAIPCLVLYVWDCLKVHLDIKGVSRTFLQTSIMETSLAYAPESRQLLGIAEMNVAIITSSETLANSYVAALSIGGILGRIVAIVIFQWLFQPEMFGIGCVVMMVTLLIVFAVVRVKKAQSAQEQVEEKQMLIETLTDESSRKYRLFADYFRRPLMVDMFNKACADYSRVTIPYMLVKLNTQYTTRFISSIFIAIYIVVKTPAVLNRELSLGVFVATISIFSTYLADAITELNTQLMAIVEGFVPLREFTMYLNLPLELETLKKVSREREEETRLRRAALLSHHESHGPRPEESVSDQPEVQFKSDLIPIEVSNVTFEYDEGEPLLQNLNLSLPQGHMVAITGPHSSGKATFVQLLCTIHQPQIGRIFVPSYLRVLHVARVPLFMHTSLLHNLTLGLVKVASKEKDRICHILELLEMADMANVVRKEWKSTDMGDATEGATEDEVTRSLLHDELSFMHASEMSWEHSLTQSRRTRLHIARALIANPEVMVLDRTLDSFHESAASDVLEVLRQHVDERGLGKPPSGRSARRPRDVFFTTESHVLAQKANYMLVLDPGIKSVAMSPTNKRRKQESLSEGWSFSQVDDSSTQTSPRPPLLE